MVTVFASFYTIKLKDLTHVYFVNITQLAFNRKAKTNPNLNVVKLFFYILNKNDYLYERVNTDRSSSIKSKYNIL